jgi:rubrerythrin
VAGTSKVEIVPCIMPNGKKIFLIDTPGFDDTYRSDTDILREIADWLAQAYQFRVRLTGIIYLHRIIDVRIGGSGMKNLRMFRKLCGEGGLGSVVLATTMWSLCPAEDAKRREEQLVHQNDLWQFLVGKGASVFRQDNGAVSGQKIIDHLVNRAQPVTLDIQREMVDQGLKLGDTGAGREVQEELEKLKEKHAKEMREIREDMEEAIKEKDEERQAELREYRTQVDRQMKEAAEQSRQLEASREQLRQEMKEQHAREIEQLRNEVNRRQKELERTSKENRERYEALQKEIKDYKDKVERSQMKEGFYYKHMRPCPYCGIQWLGNDLSLLTYCTVCRKKY